MSIVDKSTSHSLTWHSKTGFLADDGQSSPYGIREGLPTNLPETCLHLAGFGPPRQLGQKRRFNRGCNSTVLIGSGARLFLSQCQRWVHVGGLSRSNPGCTRAHGKRDHRNGTEHTTAPRIPP